MNAEFDPQIFDAVASLLAVLDDEGRIVHLNRACASVIGVTPLDARGRPFWEVVCVPAGDAPSGNALHSLLANETTIIFDSDFTTRDGRIQHISWSLAAVPSHNGAARRIVATGTDVTKSKRAADALRRREEQLRAAFTHAPIGMALGDLSGHIRQVNDAYCRITGHTEESLLGRQFLSITHPDDRQVNPHPIGKLL